MDKTACPNGVHYSEIPLYIISPQTRRLDMVAIETAH